ncbi:hypothetical protein [Limosilactobacillus reuteri]|uniref:hypothetical protein n=1 Tax=Limosilactobacillus reuteri TaxID=1598 RepID=UPI0011AF58C7|nr:hypothetical protein [Limosilactobacillus reuteri]
MKLKERLLRGTTFLYNITAAFNQQPINLAISWHDNGCYQYVLLKICSTYNSRVIGQSSLPLVHTNHQFSAARTIHRSRSTSLICFD